MDSHPDVMEFPPWRALRLQDPELEVILNFKHDGKSFGPVSTGTTG